MKIESWFRSDGAVRTAVLFSALAIGAAVAPLYAQQTADVVLHDGKILTVDNNFSIAEAVAITGN